MATHVVSQLPEASSTTILPDGVCAMFGAGLIPTDICLSAFADTGYDIRRLGQTLDISWRREDCNAYLSYEQQEAAESLAAHLRSDTFEGTFITVTVNESAPGIWIVGVSGLDSRSAADSFAKAAKSTSCYPDSTVMSKCAEAEAVFCTTLKKLATEIVGRPVEGYKQSNSSVHLWFDSDVDLESVKSVMRSRTAFQSVVCAHCRYTRVRVPQGLSRRSE